MRVGRKRYSAQRDRGIEQLRIGVVTEALDAGMCAPQVLDAFADAERRLTELGGHVEAVSIPLWADAWAIECATIFFGMHSMLVTGGQGAGHLGRIDVDMLAATVAQNRLCGRNLPPMMLVILLTVEHLRDRYLGVHFGKGQNLRHELRRQVSAALDDVDLLVTPTNPTMPFELLDRAATDEEMAMRHPARRSRTRVR